MTVSKWSKFLWFMLVLQIAAEDCYRRPEFLPSHWRTQKQHKRSQISHEGVLRFSQVLPSNRKRSPLRNRIDKPSTAMLTTRSKQNDIAENSILSFRITTAHCKRWGILFQVWQDSNLGAILTKWSSAGFIVSIKFRSFVTSSSSSELGVRSKDFGLEVKRDLNPKNCNNAWLIDRASRRVKKATKIIWTIVQQQSL